MALCLILRTMKRLIISLILVALICSVGFAKEAGATAGADFADFNYRTVPLWEEAKGLLTTFQNQVLYLQ